MRDFPGPFKALPRTSGGGRPRVARCSKLVGKPRTAFAELALQSGSLLRGEIVSEIGSQSFYKLLGATRRGQEIKPKPNKAFFSASTACFGST